MTAEANDATTLRMARRKVLRIHAQVLSDDHLLMFREIVKNRLPHLLDEAAIDVTAPADATLYVTLNAVDIETQARRRNGIAYTIYLRVEQQAMLASTQMMIPVSTWRYGGIGVRSLAQGRAAIRQQLAEY